MTVGCLVAAGIFLPITTYQDIKNKEINLLLCIMFAVIGLIFSIALCIHKGTSLWNVGISVIPGVVLLFASYITNQSIGMGDGMVLTILGLFIGAKSTMGVFVVALLISAFVSIMLLVVRKVRKEYEIPFIPFLSMATVLIIAGGMY